MMSVTIIAGIMEDADCVEPMMNIVVDLDLDRGQDPHLTAVGEVMATQKRRMAAAGGGGAIGVGRDHPETVSGDEIALMNGGLLEGSRERKGEKKNDARPFQLQRPLLPAPLVPLSRSM